MIAVFHFNKTFVPVLNAKCEKCVKVFLNQKHIFLDSAFRKSLFLKK